MTFSERRAGPGARVLARALGAALGVSVALGVASLLVETPASGRSKTSTLPSPALSHGGGTREREREDGVKTPLPSVQSHEGGTRERELEDGAKTLTARTPGTALPTGEGSREGEDRSKTASAPSIVRSHGGVAREGEVADSSTPERRAEETRSAVPAGVVRGVLLAAPAQAGRADLRVVVTHRDASGDVRCWQVPLDAEGRFALADVPPGALSLQAVVDGAPASSVRRVEVRPGEGLDGVELSPSPAPGSTGEASRGPNCGTLRGRVVSPAGAPVGGASIGPPGELPVTTDANGEFALVDLAAGLVRLEVRHPDHGLLTFDATIAPSPATSAPVVVRLGAGAELRVRVVDDRGRGAPGADVTLSSATHAAAAPSDAEGACVFPGLVPGERYRVGVEGGAAVAPVTVVLAPGEVRVVVLAAP